MVVAEGVEKAAAEDSDMWSVRGERGRRIGGGGVLLFCGYPSRE
jgi:hypothetical protein